MLFLFIYMIGLTCGFYCLNKGLQGFNSKRPQFLGPDRVSPDQLIKAQMHWIHMGRVLYPCVFQSDTRVGTQRLLRTHANTQRALPLQINTGHARSVSVGFYEHALQAWAVLCLYT